MTEAERRAKAGGHDHPLELRDVVRPARVLTILVVAGVALGWVGQQLEWRGFRGALATFDVRQLALVALSYLLVFFMRCRRAQLLVPEGPSLREFFPVVGVGFLAAVVVPLRLGILVRPWLLERYAGVPFGVGAAGAVAERMLDVLFLLALVLFVGVVSPPPDGALAGLISRLGLFAVGFGGLLGMGLLGWAGPARLRGWLTPVVQLGGPLPALVEMLAGFSDGLRSMGTSPARTAWAAVWSAWMWLLGMMAAWSVMSGFEDMTPTVGVVAAFWAAVLSAAAAVPTPASVGPFEMAGVACLTTYGVPPDLAGAVTVVMHVSMFTMNASIGLYCLLAGALFGTWRQRAR